MSIGTTSTEEYDGVEIVIEPFDPDLVVNPVVTPITDDGEAVSSIPWTDWETFRLLRNDRLTQSDWTQMPDAPLTDAQKASWLTYRQQLRDLPSSITDPVPLNDDPNHSSWPTMPTSHWYH